MTLTWGVLAKWEPKAGGRRCKREGREAVGASECRQLSRRLAVNRRKAVQGALADDREVFFFFLDEPTSACLLAKGEDLVETKQLTER